MRQYRPLHGIRVLSFEAAFSLPAATRTLADLGAEVIRVAPPEPAEGRRGLENFLNDQDVRINKSTLALNLSHEEGRDVARRLVAHTDIVCSNLRPGVIRRFGLGYPELRSIRSDVIVLQLSGYGAPGPWQDYPALGPATEAAGGLNWLIGDDSYPPMRAGSDIYADQVAGRYAVLAILSALQRRRHTGAGQFIDLSMHEGVVHLLGDVVLRAARTGRTPERTGNRDPLIAPQGIYACAGRDEWVAISVVTDTQWRTLRELLGNPLLWEPVMESVEGRHRHHDQIDAAIGDWTRSQEKDAVAQLLQERGIPAGPVRRPPDIPVDPQFVARGFLQDVRHREPRLGKARHEHLALPWRVAGFNRPAMSDPKGEGTDNVTVLRSWLGLSKDDVRRLEAIGALWEAQPLLPPDGVQETQTQTSRQRTPGHEANGPPTRAVSTSER